MAERSAWAGSAADFLRAADFAGDEVWKRSAGWPKTPRALAGRLRRAQTFLRTLGILSAWPRRVANVPSAPSAASPSRFPIRVKAISVGRLRPRRQVLPGFGRPPVLD